MRWLIMTILIPGLLLPALRGQAHDFSWDNFLLARMKLDKGFDYRAHADSYMQVFRPTVWKTYKNDEFELEDKRNETVDLMKSRVDDFSLDETFTLNTRLEIGKYDFDQNSFPVENMSENHYWYEYKYSNADFPSTFKVYLSNTEVLSAIPMEKSVASDFVKRRRDRYGNINRYLHATIKFKIVKLKNGRDEFVGEIQSAKIFDDEGRTRVVYEFEQKSTEID